jgi:hypothetical protein
MGFLEMLKWARDGGCPWDERRVVKNAIEYGSLDVLEYVLFEGGAVLDWDEDIAFAQKRKQYAVIDWLNVNRLRLEKQSALETLLLDD